MKTLFLEGDIVYYGRMFESWKVLKTLMRVVEDEYYVVANSDFVWY